MIELEQAERNIADVYAQATDAERAAGREWYAQAERYVHTIAERADTDAARVAAALAALSPRNPWAWNVQDAAAFALAARVNAGMPRATTFTRNRETAWAFLQGSHDWASAARKVRSFVRNCTGDTGAVTLDIWALRVAYRGEHSGQVREREYTLLTQAYTNVAARVNEQPAHLQAITWVVAQRLGLGQQRVTKVRAPKSGTFEWVRAMLVEGGHA
jgi:hypothetical protein